MSQDSKYCPDPLHLSEETPPIAEFEDAYVDIQVRHILTKQTFYVNSEGKNKLRLRIASFFFWIADLLMTREEKERVVMSTRFS